MGEPRTVKDLRRHRCLTGFARGELPQSEWPVGRGTVHIEAAFSSNDVFLLREAALSGLGIALLPHTLVGDALKRGALVPVLPGVLGTVNRVAVVYVERQFLPAHVREFVETLVRWAATLKATDEDLAPRPAKRRRRADAR
jgi:DNA-binding transcriptional LysR family regulator